MDNLELTHYVGVRFAGSDKNYFFSTPYSDHALGDLVIVNTVNGTEIAVVMTAVMEIGTYQSDTPLKPIVRKANPTDKATYSELQKEAKLVFDFVKREVQKLDLPMDLIEAFFSFDGTKVTVTYTSPQPRVDFRELLRKVSPSLTCRLELRQIASRDKAKRVGGIGICGLPLCCSTFLDQFEGIGIQKAKNQMLTLNIPKLSGPCGKLICCLLFEDDAYTEAKKEFPRIGAPVKTPEGEYFVDSFNVLSRVVRLVNTGRSDYKTYPLEDVKAMLQGTYKKKVEPIVKPEEELPSFSFNRSDSRGEQGQNQKKHKHDRNRRPQHGQPQQNGDNQNNRPQQNRPNQQNQQGQQGQQGQNRGNHRNRNRHRRHGGNKPSGGGTGE